jgi:hypothetical protein
MAMLVKYISTLVGARPRRKCGGREGRCTRMGVQNNHFNVLTLRSPGRPVRYVFSIRDTPQILVTLGEIGFVSSGVCIGEEGTGRIIGGTRVLEMAADDLEATLW